MKPITENELDLLKACQDADQWSLVCKAIKNNRGGEYPCDWWAKVMQSGLAKQVANNWNQPDAFDLKVEIITDSDIIG